MARRAVAHELHLPRGKAGWELHHSIRPGEFTSGWDLPALWGGLMQKFATNNTATLPRCQNSNEEEVGCDSMTNVLRGPRYTLP